MHHRGMLPEFKAGDVLLFRGKNVASWAIALGTNLPSQWVRDCAPSHVGICAEYKGNILLFESTTLANLDCDILKKPVRGVQSHEPVKRIRHYEGRVWRMPVNAEWQLSASQGERLSTFVMAHLGEGYDFDGLARTVFDHLVTFLRPPRSKTICSRFVARAAMHSGLVARNIIPDKISPAYIARNWPRSEVFDPPMRIK